MPCTRLWATSTARKSVIAEMGSAKVVPPATNVTATHAPKASAACTEGSPPWNAVPRWVSAFRAIAARMTMNSAITVTSIGEPRSLLRIVYGTLVILS